MRFEFGDKHVDVNVPTRKALFDELRRRLRAGEGFALATINLDHLVKLKSDASFLEAYLAQDLVVADGKPIVGLSRLAGTPVELMQGSTLVHPFAGLAAEEHVPVAMVGSSEIALADAKRVLIAAHPGLNIVYTNAPAFGFDPEGVEADRILADLAKHDVRLCYLALGAPKQERFAARGRGVVPQVGFLSVGAGLDFLGGHQKRAPKWVQAIAMEWFWRMMSDPRRLGPRYIRCLAILPAQVVKALRQR